MLDVEKLIAGVHDYIGRALAPLAARVRALEDRALQRGEKGIQGERGERGEKGDPGITGERGLQGPPGERGEKGEPGESIRGEKGEKGDRGEKGERGESIRGEKGEPGITGERGADGAPGRDGKDGALGVAGADGRPGKSAYQLAVERGFAGTELQWLDSLTGKPGRDGKDAASVDVEAIVRDAAALVPVPKDGKPGPAGKDVDLALLNDAIDRKLADAVSRLPAPKDGRDGAPGRDGEAGSAGKDADPAVIAEMIAEGVAQALPEAVQRAIDALMPGLIAKVAEAVPRPRDGKDAAPVDIGAIVREVVALIPTPRDGRDGRDAPELDAVVEAVVKRLPEVKDGRDGKDAPPVDMDAVVAKAAALIPVPKDGADGSSVSLDDLRPILEAETARWQLEFERRAADALQRAIDNAPKPENGKDGQDAAQLESFDAVLDGRMLTLSLTAGDRVVTKNVRMPIPIDKGVYRSGNSYEQSDTVTYSGAVWIALRNTVTKPPSADWRLCVARGRDGKDAQA